MEKMGHLRSFASEGGSKYNDEVYPRNRIGMKSLFGKQEALPT
jgi:hypothetical protein